MPPASQKSPRLQHKSNIGALGEDIAASFLIAHHFRIVERNFKHRYGELDIVALEDHTLVIVEVKTRTSRAYGSPGEAITRKKVHDVLRTAQYYTQTHPNLPQSLRIDVIAIDLDPDTYTPKTITHIPNITMDLS